MYQQEATRTFKEHTELNAYQARMLNWGIGLGGEAGEVEELIKHHVFAEESLDKMELAKELGDVLWYLSAIAETTGIRMVDIAELNLAKLDHRYHTGAYTDGDAQDRHSREAVFTETPIYRILEARINKTTAPMNVIFIGPDGSGKTTLSQEVAKKMGFKYHKCNYEQGDKPTLANSLLESQINVIYDRFYWPDDPLYCHVKNIEHSEDYWLAYSSVIRNLERHNTLYIYVDCAEEELIKRSSVWKDNYIKTDDLKLIKSMYDKWWVNIGNLHISQLKIDTTDASIDQLVDVCCDAIRTGQDVYANVEQRSMENEQK
jgi:NTP pyrophosphatase (non-canonical NTP hydrolase)/gluconate kinase